MVRFYIQFKYNFTTLCSSLRAIARGRPGWASYCYADEYIFNFILRCIYSRGGTTEDQRVCRPPILLSQLSEAPAGMGSKPRSACSEGGSTDSTYGLQTCMDFCLFRKTWQQRPFIRAPILGGSLGLPTQQTSAMEAKVQTRTRVYTTE